MRGLDLTLLTLLLTLLSLREMVGQSMIAVSKGHLLEMDL